MLRHCQNSQRLSVLSSHLHRRADIALIGLAVMVSKIMDSEVVLVNILAKHDCANFDTAS